MADDDDWITIGEATRRLAPLSEHTVRRRCDDGTLKAIWTRPPGGGQRRVSAASVEQLRRQLHGEPTQ